MKNLFFLFGTLFFMSCEKPVSFENSTIEMTRTPCFGECPDYDISIKGNGNATFFGREYAPRKGKYQMNIGKEKVEALFTAFAAANFWEFEEKYTSNISDLPTTFLTFSHEGQSKKIEDYYGAPQKLKNLEKQIIDIANMDGWVAQN